MSTIMTEGCFKVQAANVTNLSEGYYFKFRISSLRMKPLSSRNSQLIFHDQINIFLVSVIIASHPLTKMASPKFQFYVASEASFLSQIHPDELYHG